MSLKASAMTFSGRCGTGVETRGECGCTCGCIIRVQRWKILFRGLIREFLDVLGCQSTRICVLKFVVEVRKGAAGYAVYKVSKLGFLTENWM